MFKKVFKIEEAKDVAEEIIKEVKKEQKDKATIIAFSGDLGAGKTTITQSIATKLGIEDNVVSPTFVIMKIYKTKDNIFKNLVHIDAYRLNNCEEMKHLGFDEIVKNKENLVIVEWPEMIKNCLKNDVYKVSLEHKDQNTRSIKFWYN